MGLYCETFSTYVACVTAPLVLEGVSFHITSSQNLDPLNPEWKKFEPLLAWFCTFNSDFSSGQIYLPQSSLFACAFYILHNTNMIRTIWQKYSQFEKITDHKTNMPRQHLQWKMLRGQTFSEEI